MDPDFVDAEAATRLLGVKPETLYAYASRGLVTRAPGLDGRRRLYKRSDLLRLRARQLARSGHGPAAAGALRFGEPVLETAISRIDERGPIYRGESAVELAARGVPYEAIAERLWGAAADGRAWRRAARAAPRPRLPASGAPIARMTLALASAATWPRSEATSARALVLALARAIGPLRRRSGAGVAGEVAARLGTPERGAIELALVLLADHELNASTFAARVASSTGATLRASVIAALAALSGPEHGAASTRVERWLREIGDPARVRRALRARLARGEALAGFGHPLYPLGDPRAAPLLEAARALGGRRRALATLLAAIDAHAALGLEPPNVDLGLVALRVALALPPGSASALFAVGRSAGWIAHALEQRAQGFILRPRARYVGA